MTSRLATLLLVVCFVMQTGDAQTKIVPPQFYMPQFVVAEAPAPASVANTFTLAFTPLATPACFLNGLRLTAPDDFTYSGKTLSVPYWGPIMTDAANQVPPAPMKFFCDYWHL